MTTVQGMMALPRLPPTHGQLRRTAELEEMGNRGLAPSICQPAAVALSVGRSTPGVPVEAEVAAATAHGFPVGREAAAGRARPRCLEGGLAAAKRPLDSRPALATVPPAPPARPTIGVGPIGVFAPGAAAASDAGIAAANSSAGVGSGATALSGTAARSDSDARLVVANDGVASSVDVGAGAVGPESVVACCTRAAGASAGVCAGAGDGATAKSAAAVE